jgi:hypothetical protein
MTRPSVSTYPCTPPLVKLDIGKFLQKKNLSRNYKLLKSDNNIVRFNSGLRRLCIVDIGMKYFVFGQQRKFNLLLYLHINTRRFYIVDR